MGIYAVNNPGRAGGDVAEYAGWPMANIIRKYMEIGLDTEFKRTQFRRAMLVSHEYTALAAGARINV